MRFLGEASTLLAASLDYEATLADLGQLLVPRIADYCIVDTVDEEREPPSGRDLAPRTRRARSCCASCAAAIRRRRTRRIPSRRCWRAASRPRSRSSRGGARHAAVDEEHLALYHALEAMSYIVVPLEARGRLLGTISLGTGESRRRFGMTDLELAHEIARRAALAIDNARLFGAAQESYAQLDTLLVSAPVGIGFWDRDLRFIRVNDALAAVNGQDTARSTSVNRSRR